MPDAVAFARRRLRAAADPDKARAMAAYMKTAMPFYGVQTPDRKPIFRELLQRYPVTTRAEYVAQVSGLWKARHREMKYLAIGVAGAYPRYITISSIPLYRRMIVEGAWWDLVDGVAADLVGSVLLHQRERLRPRLEPWVDHRNMWLRRTAILSQLRHGERTDEAMLYSFCLRRAHESEFFIRKAIGWALREYAKSRPDSVIRFLGEHGDRLSGLSFREAAKHLDLDRPR